jgi:hypothetical protein
MRLIISYEADGNGNRLWAVHDTGEQGLLESDLCERFRRRAQGERHVVREEGRPHSQEATDPSVQER